MHLPASSALRPARIGPDQRACARAGHPNDGDCFSGEKMSASSPNGWGPSMTHGSAIARDTGAVLSIEPGARVVGGTCDHCGEPMTRVPGFIYEDDDAFAV